jgi:predicted O-methyltransferase YrrM
MPDDAAPGALELTKTARWFSGKSFTTDWVTWNFPLWMKLFDPWRDHPVRVIEIGSWEGRSALFFLNFFRRSRVTCIDTFAGSSEHQDDPQYSALTPTMEARFDANTAEFAGRVEKIKGASQAMLPQLGIEGRRFDVGYVDGSHRAADVYSDAVLVWSLIVPNGVLIFDDYEWVGMPSACDRPKPGIDAFLAATQGRYRLLHQGYQVVLAKS